MASQGNHRRNRLQKLVFDLQLFLNTADASSMELQIQFQITEILRWADFHKTFFKVAITQSVIYLPTFLHAYIYMYLVSLYCTSSKR